MNIYLSLSSKSYPNNLGVDFMNSTFPLLFKAISFYPIFFGVNPNLAFLLLLDFRPLFFFPLYIDIYYRWLLAQAKIQRKVHGRIPQSKYKNKQKITTIFTRELNRVTDPPYFQCNLQLICTPKSLDSISNCIQLIRMILSQLNEF
eukprot:TRINITY_DN35263_c1_g1_i1.p1 TRINITY_DN35263_c1_g1~~TRINITY_DN35263_c1_g1_i1.p1  ORF type:complete len:146 (+),score=0.14 TRINITY_DN35263_c1_g1_i1:331-768(+)